MSVFFADALNLRKQDGKSCMVTFAGAGGKTSCIVRLVRELKKERVVVTTTTQFFEFNEFEHKQIIVENREELVKRIKEMQDREPERTVVIAGGFAGTYKNRRKLQGIPLDWVDNLKDNLSDTYILVEGDGSARKPVKAPRDYEPVVPKKTDIFVPVLGMNVLGQRLNEDNCHRLEIVKSLQKDCHFIDEDLIVKILTGNKAYGIWNKRGFDYIPVLNNIKDNKDRVIALARKIVERGAGKVLVTSVQDDRPVKAIITREGVQGG